MKKTMLYILPMIGSLLLTAAAWGQYRSIYDTQNPNRPYQQPYQSIYDDPYNPQPLRTEPLRPGAGGYYVSQPSSQARGYRGSRGIGSSFTNDPAPLSFTPRSRFSKLPYSIQDYMQFKSLDNEPSPYSMSERINAHYGVNVSGLPSTSARRSLMDTSYKGEFLGNPFRSRAFFETQITERQPLQGPQSSESMQLVRTRTGQPVTGPVNERLLQSNLFSDVQQVSPMQQDPYAQQQIQEDEQNAQISDRQEYKTVRPLSGELEQQQNQGSLRRPLAKPWTSRFKKDSVAKEDQQLKPPAPFDHAFQKSQPEAGSPNLFEQMRQQVEQPAVPGEGEQMPSQADQSELFFKAPGKQDGPITSFVGKGESELNKRLKLAEQLLADGQYYKAADQYNFARIMDPQNPLPRLGRAMAFLAAGNYMTSTTNLFAAIQMFSPLAYFDLKMDAFLPDLRVLDRRRAELEQRLERREDFRLRFLLGFAEYYSGLKDIGLKDMTKAAEYFPKELGAVQRFVEILQQRSETQPAS